MLICSNFLYKSILIIKYCDKTGPTMVHHPHTQDTLTGNSRISSNMGRAVKPNNHLQALSPWILVMITRASTFTSTAPMAKETCT